MEKSAAVAEATKGEKTWVVRHACSMRNLWSQWRYKMVEERDMDPDELGFVKAIEGKFDARFVDAPLTRLGEKQCVEAQRVMDSILIKYVLVSPLLRTLETARIVFSSHPLRSNMKFIVHPLLRECLSGPDDIPSGQSVAKGFDYDFTLLGGHPQSFFVSSLDQEVRTVLEKRIAAEGESKCQAIVIEMMRHKFAETEKGQCRKLESLDNVRKRVALFLKWLAEFVKERKVKYEEVAVVSHSIILSCWRAEGKVDSEGKPDCDPIFNAVPLQFPATVAGLIHK